MANGHDDEYQFSELEEDDIYGATEQRVIQSREGAEDNSWRHLLLIVGGLVIAAFVGYKLFDVYFPHKNVTTAPVKPAVPTVPVQAARPVSQPMAPVAVPSAAVTDAMVKTAVEEAVAAQKQAAANDTLRLDASINELKNNMAALTAKMAAMSQSLDTLVKETEKKREPAPVILPVVKKPIVFKPHRRVKAVPSEHFYLQAVIPGRAWLMGENGTTMTVSQGDIIPGYGKVFSIDAQGGKLKTESGKSITFHPTEQ